MGDQLWVDPQELRSTAPKFTSAADRLRNAAAKLHAAVQADYGCWGNDQTGQAFAKDYVPDIGPVEKAIHAITGNLDKIAETLVINANNYEATDRHTAEALDKQGRELR